MPFGIFSLPPLDSGHLTEYIVVSQKFGWHSLQSFPPEVGWREPSWMMPGSFWDPAIGLLQRSNKGR